MMTRNTVVGVFDDRDDAQRAIEALKDAGFRADDIGVTMRDKRETEALVEDTGTSAGAGAATGALAGGALGGVAGWLVGIGALAIPGIGPIVAAGPLAAALTGAAIGAAGGGLLGALTGMGVPEDEARWYEGEVHRGGTLVTVRADGRYEEARRMMREYGAREAGAEGTVGTRGTATTMDRDYDTRPGRKSDDVQETAGTVGGGAVGGVAGAALGGAVAGPPGAVAGAAIGGTAGAAVGHEATEDKALEHANDYGTSGRWEDDMPRYRSRWEQRFGTRGGRWDEYEPAYRYAWEMRREPRYRGRSFTEIEPELRRDWETRHRDGPWNRFGDAIRDAWEGTTEARVGSEAERTVQLREEELRARKTPVETGEVEVRKEVRSERKTIDVPVTREEVVVERHPVDRKPSDRPIGEGETIRVPVREEEVSVEKRPVVREEVSIGKRAVTETERVSDTVRREEAVIDREGDVDVRGDWSKMSSDFRTRWQSRYGTSGRTWEQDEPAYRYGWESASDPRYKGRQWTEVESDLGRDWSSRYGRHGKWDEVKDRAREAWEYGR